MLVGAGISPICFDCGKELPTHYDADKKYPRSYAKGEICSTCSFKKSEETWEEVKQWIKNNPRDPVLQAQRDARYEVWDTYNKTIFQAKEALKMALDKLGEP